MANDPLTTDQTDVTTELYRAVIGPRNQDYYLAQFAKFDAQGKPSATWHWAAFFTTLNWFVFRKMWAAALWYVTLVIAFALAIFGLGKLAFNYTDEVQNALLLLFLLAMFVTPALVANALYYRFCERRITKALASDSGVQEACDLLASQASSNRRWLILALLNLLLAGLLASAANWLPKFNLPSMSEGESNEVKSARIGGEPEATAPPTSAASQQTAPAPVEPVSAPPVATAPEPAVPVADVPAPPDKPATGPTEPARASATEDTKAAATPAVKIEPVPAPAPARAKAELESRSDPAIEVQGRRIRTAKPADKTVPADKAVTPEADKKSGEDAARAAANRPDRRYFIQVGAYAEDGHVRAALVKLESIGLPAFTQPVQAKDGLLIRIRVGPFESRAEADKALARIKELDFPFVILRL
jgi:cell division protein FtsN